MAPTITSESRPRPPVLVSNLSRCPRELVHQIFDDLPLINILKILAHKIPHLDTCILTHSIYQHVFFSRTALAHVRELFSIYHEICVHIRCALSPSCSILSRNISTSPEPFTLGMLQDHLRSSIFDLLSKADPWMTLLGFFSRRAPPSILGRNLYELHERWRWVRDAETALNSAKSRQLLMAADILETNAGTSMLKKPLDPSQDGPRSKSNVRHVIQRLRGDAKRVLSDKVLAGRFHAKSHWTVPYVPLVPYDYHLGFFLKTIKMYPLHGDLTTITTNLSSTSITQSTELDFEKFGESERPKRPTLYAYPSDIAKDISLVLEGFECVYTDRVRNFTEPIVFRTSLGLWPDPADSSGARFALHRPKQSYYLRRSHNKYWFTFVTSQSTDNNFETLSPHDEREYEWLQKFLRVVSWMEREMAIPN